MKKELHSSDTALRKHCGSGGKEGCVESPSCRKEDRKKFTRRKALTVDHSSRLQPRLRIHPRQVGSARVRQNLVRHPPRRLRRHRKSVMAQKQQESSVREHSSERESNRSDDKLGALCRQRTLRSSFSVSRPEPGQNVGMHSGRRRQGAAKGRNQRWINTSVPHDIRCLQGHFTEINVEHLTKVEITE